jgi:hypothetical protein
VKKFLLEVLDGAKDLIGLVACLWLLWFVIKIAFWSAHAITGVLNYIAP